MKRNLILFSTLMVFVSCTVEPQEIRYGADGCSFCKMTIVDSKHAAQLVTTKGKAFNYDAIECMVNHLKEWDQAPVELYLVVDYTRSKVLIDAQKAHYLIAESIPSPMGANLSAFEKREDLQQYLTHGTAKTLGWNQLLDRFKENK